MIINEKSFWIIEFRNGESQLEDLPVHVDGAD